MDDKFAAQVLNWTRKTEVKQIDVLQKAIGLLAEEVTKPESAGGHMPVIKGNLRNSVAVSTSGPVILDFARKKFSNPTEALKNAIEGVAPGETAYVGFRAPYAHKVEAKKGFARLAAQRWPMIANAAAKSTPDR